MTAPPREPDPLVLAATAFLGRAPSAAETAAMAVQAGRLAALHASSLLPLLKPLDGSPGLFLVTAQDLVPVLPWEPAP